MEPWGRAPEAGPRPADDRNGQIKGFVPGGCAVPGGMLDFRISVDPPGPFTVTVHRIGHYAGAGSRRFVTGPVLKGTRQPDPLVVGRTVSCHHWWCSWRLPVPADWPPGAYLAELTTADGAYRSHIPFTVRDARPAALLLVLPDLTWQAYNLFPDDGRTGAGLHRAWDGQGGLLDEDEAAGTVCFDRPYAGDGLPPHLGQCHDLIRWAERHGYDLGYATARDLHAGRIDPARHRALVFPGPDPYWTAPMRRTVAAARDAGVSLVFLSAHAMYWRAELAALPTGDADRLLTCRKRRGPGRPVLWREQGDPEQRLLGVQYGGPVPEPHPLVVRNAGHWLWAASGAAEGEELPGVVAEAADRYFPRTPLPEYRSRILLAHSPYRDGAGARRHQETSLYQAPSGAWVFAAGTSGWCPALDRAGRADPRVQRATASLFDRIGGRGPSG
nr:N,N-dimethylformamidase beta subunit family domain-containing protein [Streptomyces aidingensis]